MRPIQKGIPGPGLLAYLATSKHADHLPLYRLEGIFARQGADISRKTMCDWLGHTAELLAPIVAAMKADILSDPLVQSDDTHVPWQDRSRPGQMARGFLWAYTRPWAEGVYDFTTSRSREGSLAFLRGFRGHVQADGYAGFNELFRGQAVHRIACMAHIRRKFFEAQDEDPESTTTILAAIQRVYNIEREAKANGVRGNELLALRADEPKGMLSVLGEYLERLGPTALPKSGMGRAIGYANSQRPTMMRYLEVPEAELDNNSCENAIRPLALGENWLFAGSEAGGQRAATIFSIIVTCKRLSIEPQAYLTDVLARIPAHKLSRIGELTPRAWQAARTA